MAAVATPAVAAVNAVDPAKNRPARRSRRKVPDREHLHHQGDPRDQDEHDSREAIHDEAEHHVGGARGRRVGHAQLCRLVNNRRLHGEITDRPGYTTTAAFEAAYYRQTTPATEAGTQ